MGRRRHASCAIGALGGAPDWATKRVRVVPKWGGAVRAARASMGRRRHASCATGTSGGAPYGATKRVR
eukprot:8727678-Pyramimonas_sp.AAC.1